MKNKFSLFHISKVLLFLLWFNPVYGIEDYVRTSFSVIAIGGIPESVFYQPGVEGEPVPLQFNYKYCSELYPYSGPNPLNFFTIEMAADGTTPIRRPVASLSIPQVNGPILIIFDKALGDTWDLQATPYPLTNVPPDHLAIFNGTSAQLMVKLGEDIFELQPGVSNPISVAAYQNQKVMIKETDIVNGKILEREVETTNRAIPVMIVYENKGDLHKIYESRIMVHPKQAYLLLFLNPITPDSKRFRTKLLNFSKP